MAAAGDDGSARQWPVRKYPKNGKQSTGAGCDDSHRRWWQCKAMACEKVPKKKTGKQSTRAGCDGSCRRWWWF